MVTWVTGGRVLDGVSVLSLFLLSFLVSACRPVVTRLKCLILVGYVWEKGAGGVGSDVRCALTARTLNRTKR